MRSTNLLLATALVAVLVAGPVLAQTAMVPAPDTSTTVAPATTGTSKASTPHHHGPKHHSHKKAAPTPNVAQ